MEITVNGKRVELEGRMSVASMLEKLGYVWPLIVVKVNGQLVAREQFATSEVGGGDVVEAIHMMSGG